MPTVNVNFDLINELSLIFLWVGVWGILDKIANYTGLVEYKIYFDVLLILIAIYIKL
jgi:hypothetical protein